MVEQPCTALPMCVACIDRSPHTVLANFEWLRQWHQLLRFFSVIYHTTNGKNFWKATRSFPAFRISMLLASGGCETQVWGRGRMLCWYWAWYIYFQKLLDRVVLACWMFLAACVCSILLGGLSSKWAFVLQNWLKDLQASEVCDWTQRRCEILLCKLTEKFKKKKNDIFQQA